MNNIVYIASCTDAYIGPLPDFFARQVEALVPTVRAELNGPFYPRHIQNQFFGSIDQRFLYYIHISQIAAEYDVELRTLQHFGSHPDIMTNVDLIKQASRLADMAQGWHVHVA